MGVAGTAFGCFFVLVLYLLPLAAVGILVGRHTRIKSLDACLLGGALALGLTYLLSLVGLWDFADPSWPMLFIRLLVFIAVMPPFVAMGRRLGRKRSPEPVSTSSELPGAAPTEQAPAAKVGKTYAAIAVMALGATLVLVVLLYGAYRYGDSIRRWIAGTGLIEILTPTARATPTPPITDPLEKYRIAHEPVFLELTARLQQQGEDFEKKALCEWDLRDLDYLIEQLAVITPPTEYSAYHVAFMEVLKAFDEQHDLMRKACADPEERSRQAQNITETTERWDRAFEGWIEEAEKCGLSEWLFPDQPASPTATPTIAPTATAGLGPTKVALSTYYDDNARITMGYPKDWKFVTGTDSSAVDASGAPAYAITFYVKGSDLLPLVNVAYLKGLGAAAEQGYQDLDARLVQFQSSLTSGKDEMVLDAKVVRTWPDFTVDGSPAVAFSYSISVKETGDLFYVSMLIARGEDCYVLTWAGSADESDQTTARFEAMLETIRFLP